jgi:opacity protein-like surface antigen
MFMKKIICLILGIIIMQTSLFADAKMEWALNMGGFSPDMDKLVYSTFKQDFFWQGNFSFQDPNGWGLRATYGTYSSLSKNPADVGINLRMIVSPLYASLIYQLPIADDAAIQPYMGFGFGSYFYSIRNDLFGSLDEGSKLGLHVLGGVKYHLMDSMYLNVELTQHFIPPIFFNNANNFNSLSLTMGLGFKFSLPESRNNYAYTKEEEAALVKMQQLEREIEEMQNQRTSLNAEITTFYKENNYEDQNPNFLTAYNKNKFNEEKLKNLDSQIEKAKSELTLLENQWTAQHTQNVPVQKHIIYVQEHYYSSPYGVRVHNGYLGYPGRNYVRRYAHPSVQQIPYAPIPSPVFSNSPTPSANTTEEKEKFLQKKKEYIEQLKNRQ